MKMLKSLFAIIACVLIPFTMTQCGTTKIALQETPFQTGEVYFEQWIAGVQGGGSGINVYVPITEISDAIQLQEAVFRGKVAPLTRSIDGLYIARFKTDLNNERDITMHADAIEEVVNTPEVSTSFPFPLTKDELGIVYTMRGVLKYTKLTKIIQKESIPMPSTPPRGGVDKG
jgi:hypothetical protein